MGRPRDWRSLLDPELLEPWEKLIRLEILGRTFEVPEKNLLLRQLQYLSDEIGYGRYCWNAECRYCEVTWQVGDGEGQVAMACRIRGQEGMRLTKLAPEIKYNLSSTLNPPGDDG